MRLSPAGRHIKAIVMPAAGSKPVRIHNQFSARRESADNKASPPASAAACRKISSFISKETRGAKNLEGRQSLTNRDSSVFRHSLDVHLQTGGLDRYGTHDSRHVPPGSKAGIRHRATLHEAFGRRAAPDLQLPPSVLALGPDRSSSSPSRRRRLPP